MRWKKVDLQVPPKLDQRTADEISFQVVKSKKPLLYHVDAWSGYALAEVVEGDFWFADLCWALDEFGMGSTQHHPTIRLVFYLFLPLDGKFLFPSKTHPLCCGTGKK